MAVHNMNYEVKNYQTKSEFSSFLPGISGPCGIPMWCYYTNRGQAISCFGVQDKDHSIMEFYPAHQAYERTPLMGFRTFLKLNGKYVEAFSDPESKHVMQIGMNSLVLEETTELYHIRVEYETLPMEPLAGLMRSVTVTNCGENDSVVEIADGMPEMIPYGVTATTMKEMGQTAKAWMQVLDRRSGYPKFKVRASMEDSAEVTEIRGMNFAMAKEADGTLLPVIVDRNVLFRFDSSLRTAYGMKEKAVEELLEQEQVECNDVPCCFFLSKKTLHAGESYCIQELYGMSEDEDAYSILQQRFSVPGWFEGKQEYAKNLAVEITDRIATKTGNEMFDGYCRQSYLDNLLRGGYPVQIGEKQVFYLYSRKHGDMERDYNFFSMLPEYYSQGNGNFRDVNQNRRCDVQFSPFVGSSAVRTFYNALQINGYNPLVIEKIIFRLEQNQYEALKKKYDISDHICQLLQTEFTPGAVYRMLEKELQDGGAVEEIFAQIMDCAKRIDRTTYGEGHWSDHWTYNLDLIESYLNVFPEEEQNLLYADESYVYTQAEKQILPRKKRYVVTEKGIRQYAFLKDNVDTSKEENRYLSNRCGETVKVSLMVKLFTLLANKVSALDPYAMGIEMEGGKPGWYDALNGLPGLLGSSMAEAYEVLRLAKFMKECVERNGIAVRIPEEVMKLMHDLNAAMKEKTQHVVEGEETVFWNAVNDAKEEFWEKTAKALSGEWITCGPDTQKEYLERVITVLEQGAEKAAVIGGDVPPTYFYYEVAEWEESEEGILPLKFCVKNTPDFLEGAVHAMKLAEGGKKKEIYESVKKSALYDRQLGMYKVNASLSKATFELGRACAFTPGWLENESVWLHMEYKYLLELLRAGLTDEFFEDFHAAAIPFLDGEVYGRSLLENSSFIVSSANENKNIHGKGFVARLSGSTAEFLQIWQIMMFGQHPFRMKEGQLTLEFTPCIPAYIVGGENRAEMMFLGATKVVYELEGMKELIPGQYEIKERFVSDGDDGHIKVDAFCGETAEKIRRGEIREIKCVFVEKKQEA